MGRSKLGQKTKTNPGMLPFILHQTYNFTIKDQDDAFISLLMRAIKPIG
jgi:hypothetical protein